MHPGQNIFLKGKSYYEFGRNLNKFWPKQKLLFFSLGLGRKFPILWKSDFHTFSMASLIAKNCLQGNANPQPEEFEVEKITAAKLHTQPPHGLRVWHLSFLNIGPQLVVIIWTLHSLKSLHKTPQNLIAWQKEKLLRFSPRRNFIFPHQFFLDVPTNNFLVFPSRNFILSPAKNFLVLPKKNCSKSQLGGLAK